MDMFALFSCDTAIRSLVSSLVVKQIQTSIDVSRALMVHTHHERIMEPTKWAREHATHILTTE